MFIQPSKISVLLSIRFSGSTATYARWSCMRLKLFLSEAFERWHDTKSHNRSHGTESRLFGRLVESYLWHNLKSVSIWVKTLWLKKEKSQFDFLLAFLTRAANRTRKKLPQAGMTRFRNGKAEQLSARMNFWRTEIWPPLNSWLISFSRRMTFVRRRNAGELQK